MIREVEGAELLTTYTRWLESVQLKEGKNQEVHVEFNCRECNYRSQKLPAQHTGVVEVFDPVNPENNVAFDFTESARRKLVQFADGALDALSYARTSQIKGEALECWRELMGSSFDA